MSTNWFYSDGQQTFGPVSEELLIAMIESGQVTASHLVLPEGAEEWRTVAASPISAFITPMALAVEVLEVPKARIQLNLSEIEYEVETPLLERLPLTKIAKVAGLMLVGVAAYFLRPYPEQTSVERLEGESLQMLKQSAGSIELQDMAAWRAAAWSSGKQLHWVNDTPSATLVLALPVKNRTRARLRALMTRSPDYGTVEILLDGEPVLGSPFNLYHQAATLTSLLDWGVHDLTDGVHEVTLKASRAEVPKGFHTGIDLLLLEPPLRTEPPISAGNNLALTARLSASHCWRGDTVMALNDDKAPPSGRSLDTSIPRHTFWDHRGSHEWVQYEWETPQIVQECAVFWWEDASRGGVASLPYFCRVLYREDSGAWVPVNASIPAAKADQWNVIKFPAVRTRAIRLAVQCVMGKSVGILEWKAIAGKPEAVATRKQPFPDLFLGDLSPLHAKVGWHSYRVSQYHEADVKGGNVLRFDEMDAEYYLWAHAPSRIEFAIPSGYTKFRATAFGPLHLPSNTRSPGTWEYEVLVDGRSAYNSRELESYRNHETLVHLDLPAGARRLTLITKSDNTTADHAFWGNPRFFASEDGARLPAKLPGKLP